MQVVLVLIAALAILAQGAARPRAYGPGVCGPLDSTYVRTATETGGQPFPMSPNEIVKMTTILTESSRSDATMILWAGGHAADAGGGFTIPIDPSVTRVTFATTFDGKGGSYNTALFHWPARQYSCRAPVLPRPRSSLNACGASGC